MHTPDMIISSLDPAEPKEASDKATCGICHRQVSRYTCPSCNVPYCSLPCFRSNEHAQCSEIFYKQQLESEIRTQPNTSKEERRRMLEMLKKFEEEGADTDDIFEEEEREERKNDDDDLAKRLGNIDIGSASASDIWNALNTEERDAFLSKLQDPTSSSTLELLRSAGLELDVVLPWWEETENIEDDHGSPGRTNKKYGGHPAMEDISQSLLKRPAGPDNGPPLLYNICAALTAYSFVTRHLGVSPLSQAKDEDDRNSACQLFRDLVPFIYEKRSKVLFSSMDEVITYMWPRLVDRGRVDRTSFVACLRDASRLLTPSRVSPVESSATPPVNDSLESLPQCDALLALSDLIALCKTRGQPEARENPASLKLRFYAAHIATLPSQLSDTFAAEVAARARSVELEGESDIQVSGRPKSPAPRPTDDIVMKTNGPLIREL